MAILDLTNATVTIGGTDVTGYVRSIGIPLDPWQEQALQSTYDRPFSTFRMAFRGHASSELYEVIDAFIERQRAAKRHRIRRMRAAYGRRRGRGRW